MNWTIVPLGTVAKCLLIVNFLLLLWPIEPSLSTEDAPGYKISLQDEQLIQEARLIDNDSKSETILYDLDDDCYDGIRLPNHVIPQHYSVAIEPEISDFTFKSAISIDVDVDLGKIEDAGTGINLNNKIVLHSLGLDILDVWYLTETGEIVEVSKVCESRRFEIVRVDLRSNLKNGKGKLYIKYNGVIRADMKGFYRSEYTNSLGETRYHATTQFQATDARRALPCFDEPAFKATFDITLIVPKDRLALSNTHVLAEHDLGDKKAVLFATTPIMSTYLVAFIVGEFDYVEGMNRGRPIRVYSSPGKGEKGRFALSVALRCLYFLEDYFDIKFPLQKIDLVAIPDFSAGAMENWGLITYREGQLLVDDLNSSVWYRAVVAKTVAHELAHQWFGNLVTMYWWDDLWLNEGFATFMQYYVIGELYPEFNTMEQFIFESHARALTDDAKHSTHPVEATVNDPEEIDALFDNISYNKGASIVALLRDHMSDSVFRAGLRHYLTKHAYKNTRTNDLWESMEFVSKQPIKEMMQSWTNQAGYPCLDVSISKEIADFFTNKHTIRFMVVQNKFTDDGLIETDDDSVENNQPKSSNPEIKWIVPISVLTNSGNSIQRGVLSDKQTKILVHDYNGDWIKFNANFRGFYIVNYSSQLRKALYPAIESKELSAIDRYNLLADAHSLTLAGKLSARELLQMTDYYRDEDSGPVAEKLVDVYLNMLSLIKSPSLRDKYKQFGRELFKGLYNFYGWDRTQNDAYTISIARTQILMTCLINQYTPAIEMGLEGFKIILRDEQLIDPSIRGAIYYTVAQYGDDFDFDKLFELYKTTKFRETRQTVAHALTHVEDESRVHKVLNWILNSSDIRNSDRHRYLKSMAASDVGRLIVWEVMDINFSHCINTFGIDDFVKIIKAVGSSLIKSSSEEEVYKKIDMLFKAHHFNLRPYKKAKQNIISEIKSYVRKEAFVLQSIEKFLQEFQKKLNDQKKRIKQQNESTEQQDNESLDQSLTNKLDDGKLDLEFEIDESGHDLPARGAPGA